jgi:hypothetical protein
VTARIAVAGGALALLVAVFSLRAASKMPDFEVYWRAGDRAAAGEPLYREADEHYQLKYLPAFAVLAIPASWLPLTVAKAVWFAVSAALLGLLLALSVALPPARRRPVWALALVALVAMAKFYGHELVLGQVNLLLGVLVVGAVHLMVRGQGALAGGLIALAIVVKPYAVLFVPWLAARREWRALAVAAAGIGVALALPVAIYGVAGTVALHQAWWSTVASSTAPNLLNADNVSLAAMYAKWIGPGTTAARLAAATALVLLAAAALAWWRGRALPAPAGLEAALLLTLIPLLSPQGWDYVFLVSTPAVVYLVNYADRLPAALQPMTWAALGTIAFSLYDVLGRRLYGLFMALSIITVCYLVVVAALVSLRRRGVA